MCVALIAVSACQFNPADFVDIASLGWCNGRPATIGVGWSVREDPAGGSTYFGTEGDDVVVIANGPVVFHGLGGNDLICINDTGIPWGTGTPPVAAGVPDVCTTGSAGSARATAAVVVTGGDGADGVVSTQSTAPLTSAQRPYAICVDLGAGDDAFHGGPQPETVRGGDGVDWVSAHAGSDFVADTGSVAGELLDCGPGQDHRHPQYAGPTPLTSCELPFCALVGPGADLSGCDLTGADLAGVDLTGANLTAAVLLGADLTGANLTSVDLSRARLTAATLTDATVTDADFAGVMDLTWVRSGGMVGVPQVHCMRDGCWSMPPSWTFANGHLVGPGADLRGADLSGVVLSGFCWCPAPGHSLAWANLHGADLTDASLYALDLTAADLGGATITGLQSSDLSGSPSALPSRSRLANGYLIGPGVRLNQADLSGIDISGVDLAGADLFRVRSGGITGQPLGLSAGMVFAGGYLVGPDADLQGADLGGLDLRAATLTGVASGGIVGTPSALPAGWRLTVGHLVGPGAYLGGADLAGADLAGIDLTDAYLNGVRSGGVTGTPAFTDARATA